MPKRNSAPASDDTNLEVSYVSPHNSDWARPWNTYRFGLLLVLNRRPNYVGLGRQLLSG